MAEPRTAMASRKILSVGIIGAGEIVNRIHLPVLSACEDVRVSYVADRNAEAAASVAKAFRTTAVAVADNLDSLPPSDVVLLAIPVKARSPYYELFAQRGVCVLAEKPLAVTLADAEQICRRYPEHALACGFQRRTYATARLARRLVAEQWFGPLQSMSIAEGALTTKTGADSLFYDADGSGGVLMDLGCHSLDLALYISGAASLTVSERRFVVDQNVDREVEAQLLLHAPSGQCTLNYLVTWLRPTDNVIELRFENCLTSLSTRPAQHIEIRGRGSERGKAFLTAEGGATTVYQAFYLEWMAFLDGVRTGQASEFSARSALATVGAVEALYSGQSA